MLEATKYSKRVRWAVNTAKERNYAADSAELAALCDSYSVDLKDVLADMANKESD